MARVQKASDVKREARINLAFTSELKRQLESIAALNDLSVNALIESICLAYVANHTADVAEYEKLRAKIREKFLPPMAQISLFDDETTKK